MTLLKTAFIALDKGIITPFMAIKNFISQTIQAIFLLCLNILKFTLGFIPAKFIMVCQITRYFTKVSNIMTNSPITNNVFHNFFMLLGNAKEVLKSSVQFVEKNDNKKDKASVNDQTVVYVNEYQRQYKNLDVDYYTNGHVLKLGMNLDNVTKDNDDEIT